MELDLTQVPGRELWEEHPAVKVPPVHLPEESHPEVGAAEEGEAEGGPAEHGQAEWNNSVPAQHSVSGRTFSLRTKRSNRSLKKRLP